MADTSDPRKLDGEWPDEAFLSVFRIMALGLNDLNNPVDPLPLTTKSFLGAKFPKAFSGTECVKWLKSNKFASNQKAAIKIGQKFLNLHLISHCSSDLLPFTTSCFYTFVTNPSASTGVVHSWIDGPSSGPCFQCGKANNSNSKQCKSCFAVIHKSCTFDFEQRCGNCNFESSGHQFIQHLPLNNVKCPNPKCTIKADIPKGDDFPKIAPFNPAMKDGTCVICIHCRVICHLECEAYCKDIASVPCEKDEERTFFAAPKGSAFSGSDLKDSSSGKK